MLPPNTTGARRRRLGAFRQESVKVLEVIRELLEGRAGEDYELYSRTINPQFMRVLKTIGFDRVVSTEHGFHGLTLGALSASGDPHFVERFGPLLPGFSTVPVGDLDALERELRNEDVALFIVEPVQGHGVYLPPAGYLEGAQELCRRYGTLFAVDEVQTGFGRTGRLFAFEHWGLEPDLVTVAKSLSGGYVPVGALLMAAHLSDGGFDCLEHSASHGPLLAQTDLAMAAGLATLHELDEQDLVERTARLGERLLELTEPFVDEFEVVREIRGLGLMWAI